MIMSLGMPLGKVRVLVAVLAVCVFVLSSIVIMSLGMLLDKVRVLVAGLAVCVLFSLA